MTLDPLTALHLLSRRWRKAADSLEASADEAVREIAEGGLEAEQPASVRALHAAIATYRACSAEVEVIVERAERRDLVAGEWERT